jgi:hypothetical protein
MLKELSTKKILGYGMLIGAIPLLIVIIMFFSEKSTLSDWENSLQEIHYQVVTKEQKQALNLIVRQHFHEADHFYIDKHLETLTFLEPEHETLQKIVNNPSFADDERIKKRLEFLNSGNTMIFSEGVVQSSPLFQETIETLVHPVEVNTDDLSKILSYIEGVEIGSYSPKPHPPQLLITEFKIDKKKVYENNEVYVLNIKLLKREFL